MNDSTHKARGREKYFIIYRGIICFFAMLTILLCFIFKLGNFFTADNLKSIAMGSEVNFRLSGFEDSSRTMPKNEGLYKDELSLVIEDDKKIEKETDSEPKSNGSYPILTLDMSLGAAKGEVLINDTDSGTSVDTAKLLASPYPEALKVSDFSSVSTSQDPLVLVIHTHATESFVEEGETSYDESTSFRSSDTSKNMVAVGKVFSDTLNAYGIPTIHCETLHDEKDYNTSYQNSLQSVKYYLEKYPSIKYVFDLHRDAIIRNNNELIKTDAEINGQKSAQIMTLVGTNSLGADHPNWQDNMNLAIKLQHRLTTELTGFARPINTRGASFNQQYAPGSLLFEIGSCANTLTEAKLAAVYLAENLSYIILNN